MQSLLFFRRAISSLRSDGWKAAYYYVRGNIRWWLHKDAIADWEAKKLLCPNCLNSNSCRGHLVDGMPCGCPFGPVALSGRFCEEKPKANQDKCIVYEENDD